MAADARVIDMSDLKDLEPLSKRLNAASDELTQALQTIQDRLNTLGVGLEVWNGELTVSDWRDREDGKREYSVTELGYGRHGDRWALLVRNRRFVQEGGDDPDVYEDDQPPYPLLRASRSLRVAAVKHIPHLIEELENEAKSVVLQVEEAKKIAESLK